MQNSVDIAALANWFNEWIRDDGAIYGFHNHSVWGDNPYRIGDFTSGHTTFASPYMAGLAKALSIRTDDRGRALLDRLVAYQTASVQENRQYRHVGFQLGETLQSSLIHNALPNVALLLAVDHGGAFLTPTHVESIRETVKRNLTATLGWGGGTPDRFSCCNQDYTRTWSKLLLQRIYGETTYRKEIVDDLNFLREHFHHAGLPDETCVATYRDIHGGKRALEPAEYYGLMVCPLIEAYRQYGDAHYLEDAVGMCRHVVRSSWRDRNGRRRFHKMYLRANGRWELIKETMLIAGMGMTLRGMGMVLEHTDDSQISTFVSECLTTYRFYQTQRGYFVSGSGWYSEADIAPSTAWHSHDVLFLIESADALPEDFWDRVFDRAGSAISILLGDTCVWVEDRTHWGVVDYAACGQYRLAGRKDASRFGVDLGWIPSNRAVDPSLRFEDCPTFYNCADKIVVEKTCDRELLVDSIVDKPVVMDHPDSDGPSAGPDDGA